MANRIGVMYLGKLVEIGSGEDIYLRAAHHYTAGLLATIPVPEPAVARASKGGGIKGELPSPINPPSGCRFRTRCPAAQDRCAAGETGAALLRARPHGRLPFPAAGAGRGAGRRCGHAGRDRNAQPVNSARTHCRPGRGTS